MDDLQEDFKDYLDFIHLPIKESDRWLLVSVLLVWMSGAKWWYVTSVYS
jgi:hypothetical protein